MKKRYYIDVDIPPPEKKNLPSPERQALNELKPGHSILFSPDEAKTALIAADNKHAKDKTWNYASKREPDKSLRIWRLG